MSANVKNELLKNAVKQSANDPAYFCRFFLRRWFPTPLPPFHLGLLALFTRKVSFLEHYTDAHEFLLNEFKYMTDPADPESAELPVFRQDEAGHFYMVAGVNNAIVVPRGFAKTTLMNAANLHELVTDATTFSVYISESSAHAERQLGNIKRQLERNDLLRAAYGNVVPTRSDSEKWGANEIQLKNGGILIALGRGSQVRGLNYDGRRPNRILLDDVEDKESVSTAEQRAKVSNWFYGDVVPAGNEMEIPPEEDDFQTQQELQITVLGTLLGADALLMTLSRDPTFNTVRFGARIRPGLMLWPRKLGEASYEQKRSRFAAVGKLAEFAREYDSEIRVEEAALFKFADISLYMPVARSTLVQVSIALDPAISDQPGRDHSALIVAGRREDGWLWMLDEAGGLGLTPSQLIDLLFEKVKQWQPNKVGIESQQYQKALVFLAREEMARRQLYFNITPIVQGNKVAKDDRIAGILQPRYNNGYVRHLRRLPMLEQQLQDFPNGKKDYADAAAMAFSLLGETAMLMAPDDAVLQDEYADLETEVPGLYSGGQAFLFTPAAAKFNGRYG